MNEPTKPNECRHFNGVQNETCEAGHKYDDINQRAVLGDWGAWKRLPCLNDGPGTCPCPGISRLTDDEVKAQEAETERYLADFLPKMEKTRAAIMAHIGKYRKYRDLSGRLPCPICGDGTLHYTYAGSYNGHVHAECTTSGCMKWGE